MPRSVWTTIGEIGARPIVNGRDFHVRAREHAWDFESDALTLRGLPRPAQRGAHQLDNAATALAAIVAMEASDLAIVLDHDRVCEALRTTRVAGRFQIVPGEVEWILDVAHNVPAATVLGENLASLPRRRTLAVCGILGDKDVAGITGTLAPLVDGWILVRLPGARAIPTSEIAAKLPAGSRVIAHAADVASACDAARSAARPGDRVLVFGSFLAVGPALEFLGI